VSSSGLSATDSASRRILWPAGLSRHRWPLALAALVVLTVLSRLPFRSQLPFTWDSVNYILALSDFDVRLHQPHPPGNPLYVLAAKGFALAIDEPNQALVWTSIFFAALAVVGTALLGAELWGRNVGVSAALLLLVNPLFWLYSEVAVPYTAEAVASLAVGLAVWRCRTHPGRHNAAVLGLALALAGGLRPTVLVLLGPLALFGLLPLGWRQRALALAVAGTLSLAWAVPLVALSGGPVQYWQSLRAISSRQVAESSLLNGFSSYWLLNLRHLASALVIGILPVAAVAAYPFFRGGRLPDLRRNVWLFLGLWIVPPLVFFFAVHFGQWGYFLLILPASSALAAALLLQAWNPKRPAWQTRVPFLLLLASQILAAVVFQRIAIVQHEAVWRAVLAVFQGFSPTDTVILTPSEYAAEFRLAGYLLPEYRVIGVSHGLDQQWGAVIESQHRRLAPIDTRTQSHELTRTRQQPATAQVYCPSAKMLVVLGEALQRRIDNRATWQRVDLPADRALYFYAVSRPVCVEFSEGRLHLIELRAGEENQMRASGHAIVSSLW